MDQRKKYILMAVAGIFVVLASYFLFEHFMYVQTENAQVDAHSVLLSAKVPGYILEVKAQQGDRVQKDQVLVQIDDRDYKSLLESAQSELLSLQARRQDAEKNFRRIKDLYASSVVSQQQYDTAFANYNEVKAKYDSAAARVAQAQLNLESTQLKAPSDGVIARTSAEIGQLAGAGTPLVGFVSSSSRWVTANFKETEIADVKIGNEVDLDVDAVPGTFKGKVASISSATGATFTLLPPDNATGNFTKVVQRVPVKIIFNELSAADIDRLHAGLSVVVKVHIH